MENNTIAITLEGFEKYLPPHLPYIALNKDTSIVHQIANAPKDATFSLYFPERMSTKHKKDIMDRFEQANLSRVLTLNTIEKKHLIWTFNCFKNYEHIMQSTPVHRMEKPKHKKHAIIIGNGPSLMENIEALKNIPNDYAVFTCWHAAHKLIEAGVPIDAVAHVDVMAPSKDFKSLKVPVGTPIIASPTVTHDFLKSNPTNPLYSYFNPDIVLHSWFASKLDSPDHRGSMGTIVGTCVDVVLLSGYRHVTLLGVDLGSKIKPETKHDKKTFNQTIEMDDGTTFYTHNNFLAYRNGLAQIAKNNENVRFYNASNGLPIPGYNNITLKY